MDLLIHRTTNPMEYPKLCHKILGNQELFSKIFLPPYPYIDAREPYPLALFSTEKLQNRKKPTAFFPARFIFSTAYFPAHTFDSKPMAT